MGFNMSPGNVNKMMKQYQKMQQDMARVQEELVADRVEAHSGGGVVTVVFNGHGELMDLTILPDAVDPNDVGMLQDLLLSAFREGQRRAHELAEQKMAQVTSGLKLPGGLG
jgi:DNA-binding YbaB/EbfC family protein